MFYAKSVGRIETRFLSLEKRFSLTKATSAIFHEHINLKEIIPDFNTDRDFAEKDFIFDFGNKSVSKDELELTIYNFEAEPVIENAKLS